MAQQLGLVTSCMVDGHTCFAYAANGVQVVTPKSHGEDVSAEFSLDRRSTNEVRDLTRALCFNLQLDNRNIFCVLGIALTTHMMSSLATAMVVAWTYVCTHVSKNMTKWLQEFHQRPWLGGR
jgi:hypothetical protein